ncbi:MAG: hypothetical protein K2H79_03770, partial [Bacteroidaceae bacterium]|nr:hypothetical protein [Bacteroidaceae bacterium]
MRSKRIILPLLLAMANAVAFGRINCSMELFAYAHASAYGAPKDTTEKKKPRYSVRKTAAETRKDAEPKAIDLRDPDNLKTEVSYNEKDNTYSVGTTLVGGTAKSTTGTSTGNRNQTAPGTSNSTSNKNQSRNATNVTSTGTASELGYNVSLLPPLALTNSYLSTPLLMTPEEYREWT